MSPDVASWYHQGLYSQSRDLEGVSKERDLGLNFSNRSDIWQAPRQQRCRDACQISEQYNHYNIQSGGFETWREIWSYDALPLSE